MRGIEFSKNGVLGGTAYRCEEGSPEHQEAKREKYRRDRLKEIERNLQVLIEIMERSIPDPSVSCSALQ